MFECSTIRPSTTKNLTLQEAIETALAMEAADKDSKTLQGSKGSNVQQVSKIPTQTNWKQSRPCYRCGKANHHSSKCISLEPLAGPVERLAISRQYVTLGK